jgi:hypothetical protein
MADRKALGGMPRFFFDTFDGTTFVKDEDGQKLPTIERARDLATLGLVDLVRDAVPGSLRKELYVEVRDDADRKLVKASLWMEVAMLA